MKIIITAGGTSEPIDKVRKITNMSKGNLGKALALMAKDNSTISKVYYVAPEIAFIPKETVGDKIELIRSESTQDLHDNLERLLTNEKIDAVIHSMAVSDYTVDKLFSYNHLAEVLFSKLQEKANFNKEDILNILLSEDYKMDNSSKVSSSEKNLGIQLKPTEKIISKIKEWSPETILVGFKLLNNVTKEELINVALKQQEKNKCDFVFANDIYEIRELKKGHCGYFIKDKENVTRIDGISNISSMIIERVVEKQQGKRK